MTLDERISKMRIMLGEDLDASLLEVYLQQAKEKILNHRYPFGNGRPVDIEPQYQFDQIELAIVLFNQRGAEGQDKHTENGITRSWRTEYEILKGIPPFADTSF